jgi:hypothetical protein
MRARMRRQRNQTERLKSQALSLREEFADVDLDVAMTFARLASFDINGGESEHAARLLDRAQEAADAVDKLIEPLPDEAAARLRAKRQQLSAAIQKAKTGGL